MDTKEIADLLLLFRALEDKPVQLAILLRFFGSAGAALSSISDLAAPGVNKKIIRRLQQQISSRRIRDDLQRKVDADLGWLQDKDNHLLILDTPDYPDLLAEICDPPVLVFCRGDLEAIRALKIAIVGSRNPTPAGTRHAEEFARVFASVGIAVTSGLALGIDSAGHRGALAADGITIAVLGTGCDVIYPMRHGHLARRICEKGLLVSEFPLGTRAYPVNFPRRNRIVTGLSLGTLVVEAQEKSGSLISARLAMEQGREVFAVPGSISSKQSRGCHQLIREGVVLSENAEQVLQELGAIARFQLTAQEQRTGNSLSQAKKRILNHLGAEPIVVDRLCRTLGVEVSVLLAQLVELEIDGYIVSEAGGYSLV